MGLLSDPEYGSMKWVKVLKKVHGPLSFICYIAALVWFVMLGNREFNNETYFSENALLPGLVTNEFHGDHAAKQFFNEFLYELEDKYSDTDEIPVPWLVAKMTQLHLDVYTHNFTLNYPMGDGQIFKGTNVYGIVRAARTPSLEALVVTAPFRPISSHQKGTAAGIALMLAFAQFARLQKYWAKDIIFLITEHEQLGMQAWLEAYHGIQSNKETFYTSLSSFWKPGKSNLEIDKWFGGLDWLGEDEKCLNPGKLQGRSGSIQAALNLEFHTPKIKYIEVKVEGLNGQLPNLDLVNLVHKLCVKSGIHHSYKNSYSWIRNRDRTDEWISNLWTMLGMVTTQMAGVPNGNHGLFHRFGIEAVTLEGRDGSDASGPAPRVGSLAPASMPRLGMLLESTLRSLNNLLERFHQSYFFYLLPATNKFISIGQYMPCLCLMCGAMLIRALFLWVTIQPDDGKEEDDKKKDKKTRDDATKEKLSDSESEKISKKVLGNDETKEATLKPKKEKANRKKQKKEESSMNIVNIGANYLLMHVLGYCVMNLPVLFTHIGSKYDQHSEESVLYGLAATSVLLALITPFLPRLLRKSTITFEEMTITAILLLIELATVCLAVGMHNFSLGLVLTTLYTPLALVTGVVCTGASGRSRLVLNLKRLLCLFSHPLLFLWVSMSIYSALLFPEERWLSVLGRGRDALAQAVMFGIVDSMIYGNWLFNVTTSVLLPMWILFWQILCNPIAVRKN